MDWAEHLGWDWVEPLGLNSAEHLGWCWPQHPGMNWAEHPGLDWVEPFCWSQRCVAWPPERFGYWSELEPSPVRSGAFAKQPEACRHWLELLAAPCRRMVEAAEERVSPRRRDFP